MRINTVITDNARAQKLMTLSYSKVLVMSTCKSKIRKAQDIKIDWNNACSIELKKTITAHSDAVGSPKHYNIFSSTDCDCIFYESMKEPAIVWNVIAARKGEKKTAAMKRLLSAVEVRIEH